MQKTELGKAAVKLLLEHLQYSDGSPAGRAKRTNGSPQSVMAASPVLLVLEATDQELGWCLRFGIEESKDTEELEFPELRRRFQSMQPQLALATAESGALVDAGGYVADGAKLVFNGKWRDRDSPAEPPRYEFRSRKAWLFDNWPGPRGLSNLGASRTRREFTFFSPLRHWPIGDYGWCLMRTS